MIISQIHTIRDFHNACKVQSRLKNLKKNYMKMRT